MLVFLLVYAIMGSYKVQGAEYAPRVRCIVNNKLYQGEVQQMSGKPFLGLRQFCESFNAKVYWDQKSNKAIIINKGVEYVPSILLIENKAMLSPVEASKIFGLNLEYYQDCNLVVLSHARIVKEEALSTAATYAGYSSEDLHWLAKIVHAEAKGESYSAKLAVANVILNRKNSSLYPNTIKGVIFDRRSGVQFTPTANGAINNSPSAQSTMAAIEALEGRNNANKALFFLNPRFASSSWILNNREFAFTMENHDFYY